MTDKHSASTQSFRSFAPKLEVTKGENEGQTFKIKRITRIGRETDNDIVLTDPKASRHHTEVVMEDGEWVVIDLGSFNQTFLNGTTISGPTVLRDGDIIGVGETEFTIAIPSDPHADTMPKSAAQPTPTPVPRPQPAATQSGPSPLVLAAGGFIILLAIAALMVLYFALNPDTPAVADDPTAAPVSALEDAPATESTAETGANTATQDLTVVYEEDFSDSFSGWDDAFDEYTRKVYGNNRYQIEVTTPNLAAWGLANRDVSDFEVEVEARMEDGAPENTYGLLFRFQDRENFYRFDISSEGFYLLSKFIEGEWNTLADWTFSEHINSEGSNTLKVSALGPNITAWVNGEQVATVTDDTLNHGNFGFFASTFGEPFMWASFDNLKLWVPESQTEAIALIPTATRPFAPLGEPAAATPTTAMPATDTPEPAVTSTAAATEAIASAEITATSTVETEEPAAEETAAIAEADATETPTPEATRPLVDTEPTPLVVSRPEYTSRDQPLSRGELPVSGQLIFPLYDAARGTYDIFIADAADGDNLELLEENASQPAASVDGVEFAYRSWQADRRGLFARPLSGGDEWGFTLFFEDSRPQFSPRDKSLIYHSRTGGREPAIYEVVNGEGRVMRREGAPIQGEMAKWHPSGEQFVYSSCLGGKCGVMLTHVNGTNPTLLTDDPSDINPEISPDGSTVAFMSKRTGNWDIYAVDLDGANLTQLTTDDSNDGLPTWAPDGEHIAFVSSRDDEWNMWTMEPDGERKRRLFSLGSSIDGLVQHDLTNSRGWIEENIDWIE